MPRETRRRWTAWLLSVAMTLSLVSDALPAFAQTGDPSAEADPAPVVTPEPVDDFASDDTGRPRLYVNFLGDNKDYPANGSAAVTNDLAVPSGEDWSHVTNPTPTQGATKWEGYTITDADGSTSENRSWNEIHFWQYSSTSPGSVIRMSTARRYSSSSMIPVRFALPWYASAGLNVLDGSNTVAKFVAR